MPFGKQNSSSITQLNIKTHFNWPDRRSAYTVSDRERVLIYLFVYLNTAIFISPSQSIASVCWQTALVALLCQCSFYKLCVYIVLSLLNYTYLSVIDFYSNTKLFVEFDEHALVCLNIQIRKESNDSGTANEQIEINANTLRFSASFIVNNCSSLLNEKQIPEKTVRYRWSEPKKKTKWLQEHGWEWKWNVP